MGRKHWLGLGLALLAAAAVYLFSTCYVVEGRLYQKDAKTVDLRGKPVTAAHYEKLREKMPEAVIHWDVPFQGGVLPEDTRELTLTALTEAEAGLLAAYLPELQKVDAEECGDWEALMVLQNLRPEVRIRYRVMLNGRNHLGTVQSLTLSDIGEGEAQRLAYFPELKTVTVTGGDPDRLKELQAECAARNVTFRLRIRGKTIPENTGVLRMENLTSEEVGLLKLLPGLKKLHIREPLAEGEALVSLAEALPETAVTWEKTVLGLTFSSDAEEIDLTEAVSLAPGQKPGDKTGYQYGLEFPVQGTREEVPTAIKMSKYHPVADRTEETRELIDQVEAAMAYFPEAKRVVMVGGLLHNDRMADFREKHREEYKVVWSVRCGNVLTRSDAEFFMPVKYHVYYLNDAEAYNLRYLEEAVAVDIGHMNVSDISFVEHMPELEYLILAHTSIRYIEPIRSCRKLKFLEVDWTGIQDLSPLADCTALEDLNIGNTGVSIQPLKEMTWLKNVWMIFKGGAYELSQALPDTKVVASGTATVDSGWRDLPNYFAMRDTLKMYYMSW